MKIFLYTPGYSISFYTEEGLDSVTVKRGENGELVVEKVSYEKDETKKTGCEFYNFEHECLRKVVHKFKLDEAKKAELGRLLEEAMSIPEDEWQECIHPDGGLLAGHTGAAYCFSDDKCINSGGARDCKLGDKMKDILEKILKLLGL